MSDIFISYVEEDTNVATQIAEALENAGYTTWAYEKDGLPGHDFISQITQEIANAKAMVLLISVKAMSSDNVKVELVQAFKKKRHIIPLLIGITYDEVERRREEWATMLGAAVAVPVDPYGVANVVPRVIKSLEAKGIQPSVKKATESILPAPSDIESSNNIQGNKKRRRILTAVGVALALVMVSAITIVAVRGGFEGNSIPSPTPTSTSEPTPTHTMNSSADMSIIKEFNVPIENINGIAWVDPDLWVVTNAGDMFKINTQGDVLATCRAPEVTPEGLAWDGETFWLFTTRYSFVYRFSINESGVKPQIQTVSFFKSPNEIFGPTNDGLAWDGTNLWYSDHYSVYKLNSEGKLQSTFASANQVAGLAWDGTHLWLAYNNILAQVNTEGKTLHSFTSPLSQIDALTWGNGCLWAVKSDPFNKEATIYALQPKINEVRETVTEIDSKGFMAPYGARGIAWDDTYLWLTDVAAGKLDKISADGQTVANYSLPDIEPTGLTWDGKTFWAFDNKGYEICQFTLDESAGVPQIQILKCFAVPQSADIGGSNGGLVWDGTSLWYSDRYNLYHLDSSGNVLDTINSSEDIRGLAWDGEYLWLAYNNYPIGSKLTKIDTKGNILLSFNCGSNRVYDLAWGNGYMWELGESGQIGTDPLSSRTMVCKTTWVTKAISGS